MWDTVVGIFGLLGGWFCCGVRGGGYGGVCEIIAIKRLNDIRGIFEVSSPIG